MTPGRGRLTLAERAASATAGHSSPSVGPTAPPAVNPPAVTSALERAAVVRHCWVSLPGSPTRCAGLLVSWARRGGGSAGRVVYAVAELDQVVLVEAWVPAAHLDPAER